jgi:hypothetical protein
MFPQPDHKMSMTPRRDPAAARLRRQFDRMRMAVPALDRWILWLQARRARLVRVPLAALLIVGGLFSFLPLLGIWMLPLGLMLLAIDLPFLQGPVAALIVRARRRVDVWRRWWRARRH